MTTMELQGFIDDAASSCLAKIKELEAKLCLLQQKVKECESFPQSSSNIERLLEGVTTWLSATEECISNIEKSISCLKPSVPWHPDKKDMLEMFYLLGDSPWSFWLTYNLSSEIDDLIKNIEVRWRSGSLPQVVNPEVGSFVCCCDSKSVFRGIILSILSKTWVRVLNIDKGQVKVVKLDTCHDMIKEFCEPHANVIHCSLTKDDFDEKKWNSDLTGLFQTTLRDSRLTVRILDQLDEMPPKFYIELYAFNESFEVETNISHWISSRLLPALQMLDKEVDQEKLYTYLDDEVLDPFVCISDFGLNDSQTNSEFGEVLNTREKTNDLSIPLEKLVDNKHSHKTIVNGHHEDESLRDKPRNRLAHFISTEKIKQNNEINPLPKEISVSPLPKEEVSKSKLLFEAVVNVAEFRPLNSSSKEVSNPVAFLPYIPKTEVAEFHPLNSSSKEVSNSSAFLPYTPKTEVVDREPGDPLKCMAAVQDSVLPGDYLPTDDDRICAFYAKYGYCWKPTCRKEHSKVHPGKWTNDAEAIYNEVINKVSLPMVGSVTRVTVTHVLCAKTFYATLPDIYSEAEDGETITSLISDLNNPECLKTLKSMTLPPCFSQLLVAYSQKKKQWLRGSVSDVYDNNVVQVFFVDYGITEDVSLGQCREILPQFIHLPYQAVYCTMSGIYVENMQDEAGKLFLEELIVNKEIEVEVVDSVIQDTRLEVIPFLIPSGDNVVEMMIKNGYCSISQR